MEIKKIIAVVFCFAILLAAVGAYSYFVISDLRNQMDSLQSEISSLEDQVDTLQENVSSLEGERDLLQNHVSTLESQVDALQGEIDRLQNELSHMNSTKSFVFEFPPWQQTIVNGTLRMNLTFTLKEGNLSIIAKINDLKENYGGYLALSFDMDDDGKFEGLWIFYADGTYVLAILLENGQILIPSFTQPEPSPYHTCVFEPGIGYTYDILLSLDWVNDLIYIIYGNNEDSVQVCFHFGLEV